MAINNIDFHLDEHLALGMENMADRLHRAEQSSCGNSELLLRELAKNKETIITHGPQDTADANEPRSKLTICGPKRLVDELLARLVDEAVW